MFAALPVFVSLNLFEAISFAFLAFDVELVLLVEPVLFAVSELLFELLLRLRSFFFPDGVVVASLLPG